MSKTPNPNRMVVKKVDGEWQVRVYENGKYNEDKSYFAMDKQDAEDTMKQMQSGLAGIMQTASNHKALAVGAVAVAGGIAAYLLGWTRYSMGGDKDILKMFKKA